MFYCRLYCTDLELGLIIFFGKKRKEKKNLEDKNIDKYNR